MLLYNVCLEIIVACLTVFGVRIHLDPLIHIKGIGEIVYDRFHSNC